jgi:MFS family permease
LDASETAAQTLTWDQRKIVFAAILGDTLEFFNYFLIGYVLAFIVGPWKLTYGESAVILLSSGIGAVPGAMFWGWMEDRIGRRKVFVATVLNFSVATGLLALTPYQGWIYLSINAELLRMPHHGFSGAGISKPPPDLGTFGIKIAGHAVEDLLGQGEHVGRNGKLRQVAEVILGPADLICGLR